MKNLLSFVLLSGAGLAAGCRALPEPVCQSTLLVPISRASGPRTITLGQAVTYSLEYIPGSSCGQFGRFATTTQDSLGTSTGRTLRQVGIQESYTGCTCVSDTVTRATTTYQFQPWRRGTFVVQFLTRQSRFFTDTLTVR